MSIYVMSDIHGRFDRFYKMLNKIELKEEDHVYILGDVIDRGRNGIDIIQYIMNDSRFTLLLGNHEKMMLDYYAQCSKEDPDFYYEQLWFLNGSLPTKINFEQLPIKKQEEILDYLRRCPLAISDLKVNDRMYYLVHAAPYTSLKSGNIYLNSNFLKADEIHRLVWERIDKNEEGMEDRCVIVGHTMTFYYQDTLPYTIWSDNKDLYKAKWIDIDCGCAKNDEYARLATLRLDDMHIFYV